MNRIKLIPEPILAQMSEEYELGVPIAKIKKKYSVDMSLPKLKLLLEYYKEPALHQSIFPQWLTYDTVIQPENWSYRGKFPFGEWWRKK